MIFDTITQVPIEIWNEIHDYIPHLSRTFFKERLWSLFKESSGFKLSSSDRHGRVWGSIFKDDKFLSDMIKAGFNPVLIGYDLQYLYYTKEIDRTKPSDLVLVLGFDGDGGKYGRPRVPNDYQSPGSLFWDSLQPHVQLETLGDYFFPQSGITINFNDVLSLEHYTTISNPRKLISRRAGGLSSAYLYWDDNHFKVRNIGPSHIVGIGKSLTKKNVSHIAGMTWEHLPPHDKIPLDAIIGNKRLTQHFFCCSGVVLKVDQLEHRQNGSFKITGWKWKRRVGGLRAAK
jgi:hypothetical protein